MKPLALGLSLAVLAACGVAYAETAAQPEHGWGGPGGASVTKAQALEMAGRMFERMDANHDGKLDASDRDARRAAFKQAMFEKIDANRDGQISRDEFMNFKPEHPEGMAGHDMHGPMGGPGMGGPGMGGPGGEGHHMGMRGHGMGRGMGGMGGMMMHMADTNHDGTVTRDEFMAAVTQHFDQMDTNHDGTVTP